jgi:hypothetical protein
VTEEPVVVLVASCISGSDVELLASMLSTGGGSRETSSHDSSVKKSIRISNWSNSVAVVLMVNGKIP